MTAEDGKQRLADVATAEALLNAERKLGEQEIIVKIINLINGKCV